MVVGGEVEILGRKASVPDSIGGSVGAVMLIVSIGCSAVALVFPLNLLLFFFSVLWIGDFIGGDGVGSGRYGPDS